MSTKGMYLRTKRYLEVGEAVFIAVLLSSKSLHNHTPRITANGSVVRVETKTDGTYGVAVQLDHYRFPG